VYSRIRSICIGVVILFLALGVLLVGAYRKGWNDCSLENRVAENETVIEMVGEKEKISSEIAKKTVSEKRKGLARYVIKGD
jgi:hypothetical protein